MAENHGARGHGPGRHRGILDPLPQTGHAHLGNDLLRILAKDKAHHVCIVHRQIRDDAASRRGIVEPPAAQMLRQVDSMKHPHRQHPANGAIAHQIPNGTVASGAAQMVVGRENNPCGAGRADHFDRRLDARRQRLLAEHMFACSDCRQRLCLVLVVRRRNIDSRDGGIAQHVLQIRSGERDVVIPRKCRCPVL